MEGKHSNGNDLEKRDPKLQAVDKLLHEDADRILESDSEKDAASLRSQFDRCIERLEEEL